MYQYQQFKRSLTNSLSGHFPGQFTTGRCLFLELSVHNTYFPQRANVIKISPKTYSYEILLERLNVSCIQCDIYLVVCNKINKTLPHQTLKSCIHQFQAQFPPQKKAIKIVRPSVCNRDGVKKCVPILVKFDIRNSY